MEREIITRLAKTFEESAYQEKDVEYWLARDLQELLEYTKWSNFALVIEKAKIACENSKQNISDHFADVSKMVRLGSGSERKIDDLMLTRYACLMVAS